MMAIPTWRGWLLLAVAGGLFGWLMVPAPETPSALVQARRDDWALAALPRRFDQTSLAATVLSTSIWGGAPSAQPAQVLPVPDPRWRIAAVYGRGGDAGVLITYEDPSKLPHRLRVGDMLPSGHKIETIGERDVCVRVGKKIYRLGVERREQ